MGAHKIDPKVGYAVAAIELAAKIMAESESVMLDYLKSQDQRDPAERVIIAPAFANARNFLIAHKANREHVVAAFGKVTAP